jgi:dienelactone hydrolase
VPATSILLAAVIASAPAEDLAATFAYDAKAPLAVEQAGVESRGGAAVHDLSFASPRGGRVPAYLVVPPGKGPFAGIVYMHWGQGNRSEFVAEALLAARAGAASIMIDAPYRRPEHRASPCEEGAREEYVHLVTDLRRAVDVLLDRAPVERARLAYVGHSLGATWGGTLAAVEPRLQSHVLMGGLPSLAEAMRGRARDTRRPPAELQKLEACLTKLEPIASVHHVGKAPPAAVFFQFARVDRFISQQAAQRYHDAARAPRSIKWYEGGHEFADPAALVDRLAWLEKRLGLKPVRPILLRWMGPKP